MKKVVSIVLNDFRHDSRVLKECRSLINAGYEVAVLAMHSADLPEQENRDGLQVYRVPISSRNLPGNIFFSAIKYLHLLIKMRRIAKQYDIIHCNDIEALPIGVSVKLNCQAKRVVYDAHEYETEKSGVQGFRKKLLKIFERLFIRFADRVITVGDKIAEAYAKMYQMPEPAVVMNCPYLHKKTFNRSLLRETLSIGPGQIILISQGTLTPDRGIRESMEALIASGRKDIELVFMGYGSMEEEIKTASQKQPNIHLLPAVPPEEVLNYTAGADMGLNLIENNSLSYYFSLPNKFFEYIHAGLGIISWPSLEVKQIIEESGAGIITSDFTSDALKEVLKTLDKAEIQHAKEQAEKLKYKYNWERQETVLLDVYKSLYKS